MTRNEAFNILSESPYLFGHSVGFTKLTELHNDWITSMVYGDDDKSLQAHRGSYKTTCVSIALANLMMTVPNEKIMFMRKTDNDVKEVITQTQKILEHPVTIVLSKAIWGVPVKLVEASATKITTNLTNDPRGTSQLVGMGIGGSLTGKHFDRIFTDDIVNVKDRISKAEREHTKLIYQELRNIINRGGRIFNTGTPWHKEDCFTLMPNPEKYDCYSTGLIEKEELDEIRDGMVGSLFAANYELKHIASEDIIFYNPQVGADPAKVEQSNYCHIDAAYGGTDSTVFTICKKTEGKYYVFGKLWNKAVDEVEDEIIMWRKRFNAGNIYCETNADKGLLAKELRKKGERIVTYHEDENKFMKIATYLKREWKNVVFVEGTDEEYIQQICEFNEEADHDDAPDSLATMIRILWNKTDPDKRPQLYL